MTLSSITKSLRAKPSEKELSNKGTEKDMITEESLKMLAEAIDKRVEEIGFSPSIPWFHKDKGYPFIGMNKEKAPLPSALYLSMKSDFAKYKYPIYLTKEEIENIKTYFTKPVKVLDGEHGHLVPSGHFRIMSDDGKLREVSDKFETEWTPERIKDAKMFFVPDSPVELYNIAQTNLKKVRPDLYASLTIPYKLRHSSQNLQGIDKLVENQEWGCDIKQTLPINEPAYYSIPKEEICMPPKDLYNSAEQYYGDLIHNLIHSRSGVIINNIEDESHEQITADLGAALFLQKNNMNKILDKNMVVGVPCFDDNEKISDVLANIYQTTTFISSVIRSEYQQKQYQNNEQAENEVKQEQEEEKPRRGFHR